MMNACRSLLISMALLAATAGPAAAGKGKPPPPHKPVLPKPPHLPRMPVPHAPHAMPRHLPPPRVSHHPRPIVIHRAVHHVRRSATPIMRLPVRRAALRTIHRYPVRRLPFRFVRRARYFGFHHHGHYRYSYFFYPGRYRWRTNYNLGHGAFQRRRPRVIGGIVQSVQGIPGSGTLLLKVFRPRSGRFR